MKTNLLFASAAAALLLAISPTQGDSTGPQLEARLERSGGGEASQLPDPGGMRRQYFGTVSEVNSTTRLMVVQDDSLGIQTLHADDRTKISQGDRSAHWSDIRVGMMVDGTCVGAPGNAYAETINIGR
jgi:hypothetical protein